ncbi:MAG: hypothetical protein H6934_09295 [Burkholderiaceae bacterium]|nr:hypothetical protein [Burkholderiaceae bacterium]
MKSLTKSDLRVLRVPVIISATLIVLAAGLAGVAYYRLAQFDALEAASKRDTRLARAARAGLEAQRAQGHGYAQRYASLVQSGAVGRFAKTVEIDRFEAAAVQAVGQVTRYTLGGRAPVAGIEGIDRLRHLNLFSHRLEFDAEPLHEERFLALWRRVGDSVGGLSAIEGCELRRPTESVTAGASKPSDSGIANGSTAAPRMRAKCRLVWYLFAPPEADPSAAPVVGVGLPGGRS